MTDSKIYTIPLRKEFQKVAFKRRTNKAVRALKEFVLKHAKTDKIVIGEELNELLWKSGITNPPAKVKVEITKTKETKDNKTYEEAFVNLVGVKRKVIEQSKKGILSKENAGLKGKLKDAVDTLKQGKDKKPEDEKAPESSAKKEDKPVVEKTKEVKKTSESVKKAESKPAETKKVVSEKKPAQKK